jgi:hypothetical protein
MKVIRNWDRKLPLLENEFVLYPKKEIIYLNQDKESDSKFLAI